MRRASFLMTVAAGLVASLAFALPTQAGTVETYAAIVPGPGATAGDIEITYNAVVPGALYDIVLTGGLVGSSVTVTGNTVNVIFAGQESSGSVDFKFNSPVDDSVTKLVLTHVMGSSFTDPIGVRGGSQFTAVPEPTSMALLGVGMAGFIAYRRFFKRIATV